MKFEKKRLLLLLGLTAVIFGLVACSSETVTVVETVIVEKQVKGDTVEVIKEVAVKGDTVEVIREVEVKGDTVEVIKEVEVKGETFIQTVIEVVEATPVPEVETFFGLPMPVVPDDVGTAPQPDSADGVVVVRGGLELRGSGVPGDSSGGLGVVLVILAMVLVQAR